MNLLAFLGNSLLVLGLSIIVANLAWCLYQFRMQIPKAQAKFTRMVLVTGAIFFCLGVSLAIDHPWVRILFAVLGCAFVILPIYDFSTKSEEGN